MDFWLIQRGTFRDIPVNEITGIDSAVSFDYMGSAEFEFGALGDSLRRIMEQYTKCNFRPYTLYINNETFYCYSKALLDNGKEIEDFFKHKLANKYGGLKEMLYFHTYFEGKTKTVVKRDCKKKTEVVSVFGYCDFWWDIENDWMVCPEAFKDNIDTALKALEAKGFGKNEKN